MTSWGGMRTVSISAVHIAGISTAIKLNFFKAKPSFNFWIDRHIAYAYFGLFFVACIDHSTLHPALDATPGTPRPSTPQPPGNWPARKTANAAESGNEMGNRSACHLMA